MSASLSAADLLASIQERIYNQSSSAATMAAAAAAAQQPLDNAIADRSGSTLNASELMRLISQVQGSDDSPPSSGLISPDYCPSQISDLIMRSTNTSSSHLLDMLAALERRSSFSNLAVFGLLAAYGLVIILSILGNFLVVFAFTRMRRLHTFTNAFILNMACSDLLITALNIPLNLARILLDDWLFGAWLCRLIPFLQVTVVYVSSWSMVFIAGDRLLVIIYPLRNRLRLRAGQLSILGLWAAACVAALPYALYHTVVECPAGSGVASSSRRCMLLLPQPSHEYRKWFSLLTFVLQFLIPLSITLYCYVRIGKNLYAADSLVKLS